MPNEIELGLTSDQWDLLAQQVENPVWRVKTYRWNPEFDLQTAGTNRYVAFDAVEWNGSLYRLTTFGVTKLVGSTWTAVSGYAVPTGWVSTVPPTLIADDKLYVFVQTSAGISTRSYDGSSWSSWSSVVADSTVAFMAAVSKLRAHYLTYDGTDRRFRFCVVDYYSGAWHVTNSQIYWGFQITSFDAATINGVDALLFTSETPGIISSKVVNTTTVKQYLPAMSICAITFKYGSWSDHLFIDYVDQWSSSRYRLYARLSQIEDKLWMTCYSSESDNAGAGNPITGYRVYASKDGRHWSRGEHLPLPIDSNRGVVFLLKGQTLYGFTNGDVYAAPVTLRFSSDPDASTIFDVSDRLDYLNVSRQDMQQAQMTLHNPDDFIVGTFLDGSCTVALTIETGYWDADNSEAIYALHGTYEIDMITPGVQNPEKMVEITARDRMAWMSSLTQSEQFHYWQPQVNAADAFIDTTNTGYGGMSHSAPVLGSYKAFSGELQIISNNEDAQCWSTFLDDSTWNGTLRTTFNLAMLSNGEYAGILFRAQDKDNYWRYYYDQASDTLKLIQVIAGGVTPLYTSSAKGWSGGLNSHTLLLDAYYCRIRMFVEQTSPVTDGTFALEQEVIIPGQAAYSGILLNDGFLTDVSAPNPQSGYFGTAGKGYNPTDVPTPPPEVLPPPSLPPGYEILVPAAVTSPLRFWACGNKFAGGHYTGALSIIGEGDTSWTDLSAIFSPVPNLGTTLGASGLTNPFQRDEKYIMFPRVIFRGNVWDAIPTMDQLATPFDAFVAFGGGVGSVTFHNMIVPPSREDFLMVMGFLDVHDLASARGSTSALVARSFDRGLNWEWTILYNSASNYNYMQLAHSNWDGVIYCLQSSSSMIGNLPSGAGGSRVSLIYRSADYGDTWDLLPPTSFFPVPHANYMGSGQTDFDWHLDSIIVPNRHIDGSRNVGGKLVYILARNIIGNYATEKLYVSYDGLDSYVEVGALPVSAPYFVSSFTCHPSNGRLLKFTATNNRMYFSSDGGSTWDDMTGIPSSAGVLTFWPYNIDFTDFGSNNSSTGAAPYTRDGLTVEQLPALPHGDEVYFRVEAEYN